MVLEKIRAPSLLPVVGLSSVWNLWCLWQRRESFHLLAGENLLLHGRKYLALEGHLHILRRRAKACARLRGVGPLLRSHQGERDYCPLQ